MIWHVWSADEVEADPIRIVAADCESAAVAWAERYRDSDPVNVGEHLKRGLNLRVRAAGFARVYRVTVEAEMSVSYYATTEDA